jgi:Flp pilus assembly protein TadD
LYRPYMLSVNRLPFVLVLLLAAAGCATKDVPAATAKQDVVGDAAFMAGSPDVALRLADETLAHDPADPDALVRRGLALTALGRLGEARDSLRKVVARQPHNAQALLALGRVQLPVDPAEAESLFQSVLAQDPHNAAALNDLGIARGLQGNHANAEAAFRAALAARPDMTAAQVNLALCLAMRGQATEAIGLLRPLADGPSATQKVRENYAAVLAMAGQRDQAEHILARNMSASEVAPALDELASARTAGGSTTR